MPSKSQQDSRQIFEWCVCGLLAIIVTFLLVNAIVYAITRQGEIDQARLDSQIAPAQRAEIVGAK